MYLIPACSHARQLKLATQGSIDHNARQPYQKKALLSLPSEKEKTAADGLLVGGSGTHNLMETGVFWYMAMIFRG